MSHITGPFRSVFFTLVGTGSLMSFTSPPIWEPFSWKCWELNLELFACLSIYSTTESRLPHLAPKGGGISLPKGLMLQECWKVAGGGGGSFLSLTNLNVSSAIKCDFHSTGSAQIRLASGLFWTMCMCSQRVTVHGHKSLCGCWCWRNLNGLLFWWFFPALL